jgi:uncharacterized protein YjbI with pentapeptide repeats
MAKARPGDLAGRWTKSVVRRMLPLLVGRSVGPGFASSLVGVVEADGRAYFDLRAFPFAERFKGVALDRVDFSGCVFDPPAGFTGVTATDCRLVGARIVSSIRGTFTDCRFDRASFASIMGWPDTRFVRCAFDGASFRGGGLDKSAFEDCSFRGCKLIQTDFRDCRFDGCDFTDATFRDGGVCRTVFSRVKNNFKYADANNYQIKHQFVTDPTLPVVDLGDVIVLEPVFRSD